MTHIVFTPVDRVRRSACGWLKSRSCSQRIFRLIPRATCAAASLAATFRISRSLSPPCLGTTRTGSGVLHARLAEIPSCSQRIFRLIPRATCAAASLAATFRISRSLSPPCLGTTRTGSGVLHARLAEIPSCSQRIFRLIPRATCAAASLAATFRISRSLPLLASARHTARVRRCERQPLPHLRKPGMQIRGKVRSGQPGPTVSSSFPRYPAIDLNEIGAGLSAQPPSGFSSSPPDGAKRSRATFRRSTTGCSG